MNMMHFICKIYETKFTRFLLSTILLTQNIAKINLNLFLSRLYIVFGYRLEPTDRGH